MVRAWHDQNWQRNKNSINRKAYQFHLRTRTLTTVPYRLQTSCEEIFYVLIPWYRVYELIYKTKQDSRLFQLKVLYRILATSKMLNIWGIKSSKLLWWWYRINSSFIFVLHLCSLFLVTGSGMVKKSTYP